jgi:hypothetical protein
MATSNLLPSSIQRIRVFLLESCGMKVKPWAGVEETLEALHAVMVDKRACGIFWRGLRDFLATLANDLKQRQDAQPGALVDNEILEASRYEALLDEIRAAVNRGPHAGFRPLTRALSLPAAGLLLLLAGVASVGCDTTSLRTPADAAVTTPPDTNAPGIAINLDAHPAWPDANVRTAPFPCDGGGCTMADVMEACGIAPAQQAQVSACLDRLRDSWRENLGVALAEDGCGNLDYQLACFLQDNCGTTANPKEFNERDICRPVPVYLGVRFT